MTSPALLLYAAWVVLTAWLGWWAFNLARNEYLQKNAAPSNNHANWPAFWGIVVAYTLYVLISLFLMLVHVSGIPVLAA